MASTDSTFPQPDAFSPPDWRWLVACKIYDSPKPRTNAKLILTGSGLCSQWLSWLPAGNSAALEFHLRTSSCSPSSSIKVAGNRIGSLRRASWRDRQTMRLRLR